MVRFLKILFLLVWGLSTSELLSAQPSLPQTARAFHDSDTKTKGDTLNGLATHRLNMPATDLVDVVSASLVDSSPQMRRRALAVIAGRAGAVRFNPTNDMVEKWKAERSSLRSLRKPAMQLLEDTDQLVRRDAIIALGNLEYEWGGARNDIQLPADMLQRFAERYDVEPSPIVRAELAKAFAFVPNRSPLQESSLLKALNDNAPGVLQHAVSGVAKLRIGSALQRLIQLLGHENRAVRLSVATALAEYGSEARSYLPSINSAIAVENDPTVRKALESAIARVGQ